MQERNIAECNMAEKKKKKKEKSEGKLCEIKQEKP